MVAELPNGAIEPLLWLKDYTPKFQHDFRLRTTLLLPRGTVIRGVPAGNRLALIAGGLP